MASQSIVVVNVSGVDMFVTGKYGSDLSDLHVGQKVPTGHATTVATWNSGSVSDNWDYVYLGTTSGENRYQLYMESTTLGTLHQFMGFYTANPNNSDSNPAPFKDGTCYLVGVNPAGDWVYAFLKNPS